MLWWNIEAEDEVTRIQLCKYNLKKEKEREEMKNKNHLTLPCEVQTHPASALSSLSVAKLQPISDFSFHLHLKVTIYHLHNL